MQCFLQGTQTCENLRRSKLCFYCVLFGGGFEKKEEIVSKKKLLNLSAFTQVTHRICLVTPGIGFR